MDKGPHKFLQLFGHPCAELHKPWCSRCWKMIQNLIFFLVTLGSIVCLSSGEGTEVFFSKDCFITQGLMSSTSQHTGSSTEHTQNVITINNHQPQTSPLAWSQAPGLGKERWENQISIGGEEIHNTQETKYWELCKLGPMNTEPVNLYFVWEKSSKIHVSWDYFLCTTQAKCGWNPSCCSSWPEWSHALIL